MKRGDSQSSGNPWPKARTASKEVRRQQLIDATIDSIARLGISQTTMTQVTQSAGVSIGLANFHFSTKQKLFEETLRFLAEEHRAFWKKSYEAANLAPQDKLRAIVAAHFHRNICNRRKLAVWYAFFGEANARASYRALAKDIDAERRDVSVKLCRQIIRDGDYDTVSATDVVFMLEGLYDGFWLNFLIYPREFTREDGLRRIEAFLSGMFPQHF